MLATPWPQRCLSLAVIGLILSLACTQALAKSREKALEETLHTYAATIRWGAIEQAESFVDPAYRLEHPLTQLDLDRYKQIRVTAYNETAPIPVNDNEVRQTVEIGLININTNEARNIIDRQVWKYDRENKLWLLSSGLPDITQRD